MNVVLLNADMPTKFRSAKPLLYVYSKFGLIEIYIFPICSEIQMTHIL